MLVVFGAFVALDHAAGDALAGVPGGLALQVICFLVNDDRVADDRIVTVYRDALEHLVEMGMSAAVGVEVAEVTGVMLGTLRAAVLVFVGVPVSAGAHQVR